VTNNHIAQEPPVGPFLESICRAGLASDQIVVSPPAETVRSEFFFRDPIGAGQGPFARLFISPEFRVYRSVAHVAARLRNMAVIGSDGIVMHNDQVVADTANYLTYWAPGSLVESYEAHKFIRLRRPLPISRTLAGECMIGFSGSWRNYAHWIHETLPRLTTFLALKQNLGDLKIILPHFDANSFQQQVLDILHVHESDIIRVNHGEVLRIEHGLVMNSIDLWSVPGLCKDAADVLARAAVSGRAPSDQFSQKRLYIHRSTGARQVSNFEELRPILYASGFDIVSFEEMSVRDQIRTMSDARYVIGEHGAGLVNILFSSPRARVLELFNPFCIQPAFWSLASLCRFDFGYMIGEHTSTAAHPQPSWNSHYRVPAEHLRTAVDALLNPRE
jgi:capsular polysaccharide biosynthesis protein